jgi:hypothetical protein
MALTGSRRSIAIIVDSDDDPMPDVTHSPGRKIATPDAKFRTTPPKDAKFWVESIAFECTGGNCSCVAEEAACEFRESCERAEEAT